MTTQNLSLISLRGQSALAAQSWPAFILMFLFAVAVPRLAAQYVNDHNPIGVTGSFEGVITTGCAYNVLNHNATRQIDDIVVPGSIGKYPLKMTRYYNSRSTDIYSSMGAGWRHEYQWEWAPGSPGGVAYPNGNTYDGGCEAPVGVSDGWESQSCCYSGDFRLADGGKVHFDTTNGYTHATKIFDPYGQETDLTYNTSGLLTRVTEPGGRYLQFNYSVINGVTLLTEVDANDGQGHQTDSVVYHYTSEPTGGTVVTSGMCLTSVHYSDGTNASYTYTTDNSPESPSPPCPCNVRTLPLIYGCDDVRYHGAMRRIAYGYQAGGPHGAILNERYWDGSPGDEGNGVIVSRIDPALTSPLVGDATFPTTFTEYRGDGPTRTFNYTAMRLHRFSDDSCPTSTISPYLFQQFLQNYTDFQGNTTYLGYDANWYVNSVRDANNHTVSYTRGPPAGIGQITQIMYPGNVHTDYTYQGEPGAIGGHYLATVSDELQNVTTYNRNGTTHQVYEIDYPDHPPDGDSETFSYNNFGQVLNHRLRNGAWERFAYDSRGLLTDKWNPKSTLPADGDPHTHYDYYTAADNRLGWIDRVKQVTHPANWLGHVAYETYEYERAYDANGITNLNGGAVAGRGLPTKAGHADGTYKLFKYDWYGNKVWEDDELRNATSYTYDDYNRRLTLKDPIGQTTGHQTIYTYNSTNGNNTDPHLHTTNNPDTITTPAGIVTKHIYDENFRKVSTTAAYGTPVAATTSFDYDNVGNLSWITDPLIHKTYNTYDARNRKVTTTEAYGTSLARTTTWHYNAVSNIYQIDRPDQTSETKTYDEMNRLFTDTVPKTPTVSIVTTFNYNPSGTLNWVKDGENRTTYFTYDASDRKTMMTYPDSSSTQQWQYDDAGNLELRTTVGGDQEAFFTTFATSNTRAGGIPTGTTGELTGAFSIMMRLAGLPKLKMGYMAGTRISFRTSTVPTMPPGALPRSSKLSPGWVQKPSIIPTTMPTID